METTLIRYINRTATIKNLKTGKDETRQIRGCVAATKNGVGWSLCNTSSPDIFLKDRAKEIAVGRAEKPDRKSSQKPPYSIAPEIAHMANRRLRYFKVGAPEAMAVS